MNRKKKRLKLGKLILFIVIIVIITLGVIFGIKKIFGSSNIIIKKSYDKYLASENNVVSIYEYSKNEDGTEVLNKSEDITRGTKISTKNDKFTYEEKEYTLINYNDKEYYVLSNELVDNEKDVVLEKSKFVRTSVTVYKNEVDSKIESFIKKGNELEILDYDKLLDNGNVNMFKIKKDDISGWVYAK